MFRFSLIALIVLGSAIPADAQLFGRNRTTTVMVPNTASQGCVNPGMFSGMFPFQQPVQQPAGVDMQDVIAFTYKMQHLHALKDIGTNTAGINTEFKRLNGNMEAGWSAIISQMQQDKKDDLNHLMLQALQSRINANQGSITQGHLVPNIQATQQPAVTCPPCQQSTPQIIIVPQASATQQPAAQQSVRVLPQPMGQLPWKPMQQMNCPGGVCSNLPSDFRTSR